MSSKIALVCGASGNLGKSVCLRLLSDGYAVVGTSRSSDLAEELLSNPNFIPFRIDLTQESEVEALVSHILTTYHQVDFAALLVGGFAMGTLDSTSLEDIQKMYQINFAPAYLCSQRLSGVMKNQKKGGHIVLVGARPALESTAAAGTVSYALSKSLLFRLSEIINATTSQTGVRCSVIVPSIIDTPPNREAMPQANPDDWVTPDEIAETIGFLASDASKPLRETVVKLYGNA